MKYQKIWSLLVKHRPKPSQVIVVYSDRLEESARQDEIKSCTMGCRHYTVWKNQITRSCLVGYEPTPSEQEKIMSHPNFSGFDRIDSIKICTLCGLIVARNKKTE